MTDETEQFLPIWCHHAVEDKPTTSVVDEVKEDETNIVTLLKDQPHTSNTR